MKNILLYTFTEDIINNPNLSHEYDELGQLHIMGRFGRIDEYYESQHVVIDYPNFNLCSQVFRSNSRPNGTPGELEHPSVAAMLDKIYPQKISHKVVDFQCTDNGYIMGEIVILNTPNGKIAQSILEGGLPLYIALRAECTIDRTVPNLPRIIPTNFITLDLVAAPKMTVMGIQKIDPEPKEFKELETNKTNTSMEKEKQIKRNKKLAYLNGTYQVNQKKRATTYFIVSKGEVIAGVAKCNENEPFNEELGRQIAYRRAHYNQRDRDLLLLRMFIEDMKATIEAYQEAKLPYCKHYEIALQSAAEEEKIQLDMMRSLRREINELVKFGRVLTDEERNTSNDQTKDQTGAIATA